MRALFLSVAVVLVSCGVSSGADGTGISRAGVNENTSCSRDADCALVDDYCASCACNPVQAGTAAPTCKTPVCETFAELCMGKSAVCTAGHCAVR